MQKTTNLQLNKPDTEDYYDISVQNENMDIIDQKVAEIDSTSTTAKSSIDTHITNKSNPHSVTKAQVGLSNVPNVSTNDQTPTFTVASSDANLTSGEKLSIAFGKIAKAISSLISHLSNTGNPHSVTKSQVGLENVPNVSTNNQTPTYTEATSDTALKSGENLSTAFGKISRAVNSLISHITNTNNPHNTTATQVGLGNVPNVATNDQTPTYTVAGSNTALTSGEKLNVAFGKIAKAINSLISHLSNTSNPHSVTATQVGLGNVANVTTNNQTPTYTVASSNTALSSGENLSTAFGKIAKAINSLISHLSDTVGHITSAERTAWNGKLDATGTVAKATSDGNGNNIADTYATKGFITTHTGDKNNPHSVTAGQIGAVPTDELSIYNFTNKNLATVNIDKVFTYNYITAVATDEFGTRPDAGWCNVINLCSTHFITQLAFSCTTGTTTDRETRMWIRERYNPEDHAWSDWARVYTSKNITAGTADLIDGASMLGTGSIYLVYE